MVADLAAGKRIDASTAILLAVTLLDSLGYNLILPLQPFLAVSLGADASTFGEIIAIYAFCSLLSAPIFGKFADTFDRRLVLFLSMVGTAVSYCGMAFAPGLVAFFLFRALGGLMAGNLVVIQAALTDATDGSRRAQVFGWYGAALGLGAVLGPVLGGLSTAVVPGGSTVVAFGVSGAVALVAAVAILVLLPRLGQGQRQPDMTAGGLALTKIWRRPGFVQAMVLTLGASYAINAVVSMTALYTSWGWHWGPGEVGILLTLSAVVYTLIQVFAVRRISRLGDGAALAAAGAFLLGVSVLGIGQSSNLAMLSLSYALFSISMAITVTFCRTLTAGLAGSGSAGTSFGLYQLVYGVSQIVAPFVSGILFVDFSPRFPFETAAAVIAACAILAVLLRLLTVSPQKA